MPPLSVLGRQKRAVLAPRRSRPVAEAGHICSRIEMNWARSLTAAMEANSATVCFWHLADIATNRKQRNCPERAALASWRVRNRFNWSTSASSGSRGKKQFVRRHHVPPGYGHLTQASVRKRARHSSHPSRTNLTSRRSVSSRAQHSARSRDRIENLSHQGRWLAASNRHPEL